MTDQTTTTFDNSFAHELAVESWSLYGIGVFLIGIRIYSRLKFIGLKNFQADDYVSLLAAGLYTGLVICLNVIARGGGSNLYEPGTDSTFTPEDIRERIHGSKIVVVSEQCMLNCIYSLKVCLLIFYVRLTDGLSQIRMVKGVAIAVGIGWVSTQIAFFTACRPFHGYWAVPPPNPQCTTFQVYAIVQACFNIPTDLAMLSISLPLVYKMHVPWKQKIMVMIIFSMGLFVVIAAILTKVFNLTDVYSTSYMLWYIREASVATYVANLPMMWPLIRQLVPWFGKVRSTRGYKTYYPSNSNTKGLGGSAKPRTGGWNTRTNTATVHTKPDREKDEIAMRDLEAMSTQHRNRDTHLGKINVTTTFAIEEDDDDERPLRR